MRLRFGPLRTLLFLLIAIALPARALAQARINGTVVDDAGKPIKAATVTAESVNLGQSFSATTDDKGQFTMIGLRPGQWRLIASAPGYLPEAGEVNLRSGNNANPPVTIGIRRSGAVVGALGGVSARDLQAQLATADALFEQKKWDEAATAYRAILSRNPTLTNIHLQIAAAHRGKGDNAAAIASYRELLRAEPDSEKARLGIAAASVANGDLAAAEAALTEATSSPTAGRDAFLAMGDFQMERKKNVDQAVTWYKKAASVDPSWARPLYRLGLVAMERGDKTAAADYMTKALSVDPSSAEATLARATIDQLNK